MNFGFISLLLTISEVPISKICINEAMANSFHPCKDPTELVEPASLSATEIAGSNSNAPFSNETMDETYCESKVRNIMFCGLSISDHHFLRIFSHAIMIHRSPNSSFFYELMILATSLL